ncbi:hypothetical protein KVL81_05835 [Helicobacter pylori]|nr:hypothetical protein KVL81_04105 [Helicobacter pylori]WRA53474.1 hypothetical protein KVL81_05835 [Helicobacter pylori]
MSSFSLTKNAKKDFASNPPKKTQRLKNESSGDWQKEKDQNSPYKKRKALKKESSKKGFKKEIPLKRKA